MESERQPLPIEANASRLKWLPLPSAPQDSDEGGLNLGQVFGALRRKLPVIAGVATVVASGAVLRAMSSTPTYASSFEILTKPVTVETQVISSVPQTLSNKEQTVASNTPVDETKLKLLKSPSLLAPIAKQLKSKYPDITSDELAANLVVLPLPNSEILNVAYQDKNRDKVKDVLNLVSAAYLKYSLDERLADVQQGIDFVDVQLPQLEKRVEKIQDRLQSFRQQYNLIDPDSASKQLADQTATIAQQRLETQVRLNEARALYADIQSQFSQRSNERVTSSALSENPRYQALLNQLLEIESQIAKESSLFREDTPNIQVLRDQKNNLLPLLEREGERVEDSIASRIRELEARNQILAQSEQTLIQRVKNLSIVSRQYADIQQELKIANENLNQFLAKREALRIDAGQKKTPWQVLTPPGEPVPSPTNVKRSAMLGVILGLLLGVGAALLLDRLSNVVHTSKEAKLASKLPLLGVIPFNAGLGETEKVSLTTNFSELLSQVQQRLGLEHGKSNSYSTSPFFEAFRSLFTNIQLLNSDTQIRSFVITSSVPGEGKSTVAIYLAQAAAALGQRVLLVDTDLRLPQIHNRLELLNGYGLSNLIASEELTLDQVVQQSHLDSDLYVLTAGQIPPDPTKLLSSKKMQALMEQCRAEYDLVIYDSPPLIGLADTKLIASKTDGVAMVVGLGRVKNSEFTRALDDLKSFPGTVLGIIANGSKEQDTNRYTYHRYFNNGVDADMQEPAELPAPALPTIALERPVGEDFSKSVSK